MVPSAFQAFAVVARTGFHLGVTSFLVCFKLIKAGGLVEDIGFAVETLGFLSIGFLGGVASANREGNISSQGGNFLVSEGGLPGV